MGQPMGPEHRAMLKRGNALAEVANRRAPEFVGLTQDDASSLADAYGLPVQWVDESAQGLLITGPRSRGHIMLFARGGRVEEVQVG